MKVDCTCTVYRTQRLLVLGEYTCLGFFTLCTILSQAGTQCDCAMGKLGPPLVLRQESTMKVINSSPRCLWRDLGDTNVEMLSSSALLHEDNRKDTDE